MCAYVCVVCFCACVHATLTRVSAYMFVGHLCTYAYACTHAHVCIHACRSFMYVCICMHTCGRWCMHYARQCIRYRMQNALPHALPPTDVCRQVVYALREAMARTLDV